MLTGLDSELMVVNLLLEHHRFPNPDSQLQPWSGGASSDSGLGLEGPGPPGTREPQSPLGGRPGAWRRGGRAEL